MTQRGKRSRSFLTAFRHNGGVKSRRFRVRSLSRLRKRKPTRPRSRKPKIWSKRRSARPDTLMSPRATCFIATIEKKRRPISYGNGGKRAISDLVQISKYARFNPAANRRETWEE